MGWSPPSCAVCWVSLPVATMRGSTRQPSDREASNNALMARIKTIHAWSDGTSVDPSHRGSRRSRASGAPGVSRGGLLQQSRSERAGRGVRMRRAMLLRHDDVLLIILFIYTVSARMKRMANVDQKADYTMPKSGIFRPKKQKQPLVSGCFHCLCGGGGGNRTRVRRHSPIGSTCLVPSFALTLWLRRAGSRNAIPLSFNG